jgi:hypothetical protein
MAPVDALEAPQISLASPLESLIGDVRQISRNAISPLTSDIDAGFYPSDELRELAGAGAMSAHLKAPHGHDDMSLSLKAMAEVSQVCGSTGFLMWCHGVCGLYLQHAASAHLRQERLLDHVSGFGLGGTALSNPMKSYAKIETFLLHAKPVAGGYVVSGSLPWVSHLGPEHYCGAIARIDDGLGENTARDVMFLLDCADDAVDLQNCPSFSGMEGTGTYALHLNNYIVGDDRLIADPAQPFIRSIRAKFVLLQTGWAAGVIQGGLQSIRAVQSSLGHVNRYLDVQPEQLQDEFDHWWDDTLALSRIAPDGSDEGFVAVLKARARGSVLSLKAAQAGLLHQGARGYLMTSPVQRRIRESHFVAIVTPALKHIYSEIERLEGPSKSH